MKSLSKIEDANLTTNFVILKIINRRFADFQLIKKICEFAVNYVIILFYTSW